VLKHFTRLEITALAVLCIGVRPRKERRCVGVAYHVSCSA